MRDKYFLDTNVLVYSFDSSARGKNRIARDLIENALVNRKGVISYQVVQEFLNVALRKYEVPLSVTEARNFYLKVLKPLCVLQSSSLLTLRALTVDEEGGCQWYDALIIAAAIESGAKILYSEDLQDNRRFEGVVTRNPF